MKEPWLALRRAFNTLQTRVSGSSTAGGGVSIEEMRLRLGRIYETQITPDQITADQDNYDLGARGQKRLTSDAARVITGVLAGDQWTEYEVWNVGAFDITLKHQSGSSSAANRIICAGSADIVLVPDDQALLRYDLTTQRYRGRRL